MIGLAFGATSSSTRSIGAAGSANRGCCGVAGVDTHSSGVGVVGDAA
jgi:hypothetical protein